MPPTNTTVKFGRNTSNSRNFDFARWYGAGIDPITYACQRQIERFLAGQEGALTVTTVVPTARVGCVASSTIACSGRRLLAVTWSWQM